MQRDPKPQKPSSKQSEESEATANLDATLEISFEDKVQRYWNDNKLSLIVTIPLCFILVGAYQGYKMLQNNKALELQSAYQNAYDTNALEDFVNENSQTLIAGLSALKLANEAYTSQDYQGALNHFKQAELSLSSSNEAMKSRASLGLAFSSMKLDEAEGIVLLDAIANDPSQLDSVRAEAAYALASKASSEGKPEKAKAYATMIQALENAGSWSFRINQFL